MKVKKRVRHQVVVWAVRNLTRLSLIQREIQSVKSIVNLLHLPLQLEKTHPVISINVAINTVGQKTSRHQC